MKLDLATAGAATFTAGGSVGQVYVTGATAGDDLAARARRRRRGRARAPPTRTAAYIFRDVPVGTATASRRASGTTLVASRRLNVTSWTSPPPASFYAQQKIGDGYGYLRMRDGITLSMTVKLPGPADKGPYPTVIEYSGYSPADPKSPQPSTLIAQALGYATVGINMRGTGCSGGAFDFFEQLQSTDGYDAIETIAAQPWVAHHKVGLVGLSYPAISQLFVAQLRPPHLAAIAPLSVIDDTIKGTLAPGRHPQLRLRGRVGEGSPARRRARARRRPVVGDRSHQGRRQDVPREPGAAQPGARHHPADQDREVTGPTRSGCRSRPSTSCNKINVPVYLAGDWQDEQTGGYFANLFGQFTGTKEAWLTAQNGSHADPLDPTVFARWVQFLSIFVAQKIPTPDRAHGARRRRRSRNMAFGVDRAAAARSVRERDDLRAGEAAVRELPAGAHPVRERRRRRPGRARAALRGRLPVVAGARHDRDAVVLRRRRRARRRRAERDRRPTPTCTTRRTSTTRRSPAASQSATWVKLPDVHVERRRPREPRWRTRPRRSTHDVTVIGNASVDLWLKSTAPDTDIQVTITEVRPDGKEMYVQNGWLRASDRALVVRRDRAAPDAPADAGRGADAAGGQVRRARASRCSRSRTCSAPVRASA